MRHRTDKMRVALVHYWLVSWGGGERVLRALGDMFPHADIFTVVATDAIAERFRTHNIHTSFLQSIPGSCRWHRHFLPLYPIALEQFDLRGYDLVISSSSGPAHGVLTSPDTCHISYCHSPARYLWDLYHDYVGGNDIGGVARPVFRSVSHYMRMWDLAAAARVNYFAANSFHVARRIRKIYRRHATVVYPPVAMPRDSGTARTGDYYLVVSRLVGYKRIDLAIEACKRIGHPLHVVGNGPLLKQLQKVARNSRVEFYPDINDEQLAHEYAHCRALLFPGEDDFGLAPVEAQAYGRPVVAYAKGGVLETVVGPDAEGFCAQKTTGIFFSRQTVECLCEALRTFESSEMLFQPTTMRANALRFSATAFRESMCEFIDVCLDDMQLDAAVHCEMQPGVRTQAVRA